MTRYAYLTRALGGDFGFAATAVTALAARVDGAGMEHFRPGKTVGLTREALMDLEATEKAAEQFKRQAAEEMDRARTAKGITEDVRRQRIGGPHSKSAATS